MPRMNPGRAQGPAKADPLDDPLVETPIPTRLLILGLERVDGTVDAQEAYEVGASLGMTEQQVRLGIRRVVAAEFFRQEGRGRHAVLRRQGKPRSLAVPEAAFTSLALAQDADLAPWDGYWRLHVLSVPERVRTVRDQLRIRFTQLGAAALAGGVYVSPHDLRGELAPLLKTLAAERYHTFGVLSELQVGGVGEPAAAARQLWPLADLGVAYDAYRANTTRPALARLTRSAPPLDRNEATRMALTVLVGIGRVMQDDPLLPAALLPARWSGRQARRDVALIATRLAKMLGPNPPAALQMLLE